MDTHRTSREIYYTGDRQAAFRRRVLESRLQMLTQEIEGLLGDVALLQRLGLHEAAAMLEVRVETLTREALRHRQALDQGLLANLVEVVAPQMAFAS